MGGFFKKLFSLNTRNNRQQLNLPSPSENQEGKIQTSTKVEDVISDAELQQMFNSQRDEQHRHLPSHPIERPDSVISSTSNISNCSFHTQNYELQDSLGDPTAATRQQTARLASSFNTDEPQLSDANTMDNILNNLELYNTTAPTNGSNNNNNDKIPNVYISYVQEANESYTKVVINIANQLRRCGVDASLDLFENLEQAASLNSYLENKLKQSDNVILCITPSFSRIVSSSDSSSDSRCSKHTRYIHNRLMTEYMFNECNNKRVIPVLCGDATENHVPPVWQNTHAYHWPKDKTALLSLIFRVEKFQKPPIGQRPPEFSLR